MPADHRPVRFVGFTNDRKGIARNPRPFRNEVRGIDTARS
jgi:hypothetical protein